MRLRLGTRTEPIEIIRVLKKVPTTRGDPGYASGSKKVIVKTEPEYLTDFP